MKLLNLLFNKFSRKNKLKRKNNFTKIEASEIAKELGLNFSKEKFTLDDFTNGLNVELEHGTISPSTNVTNNNLIITGKIALAHLNEFPDYYVRLSKLEDEAKAYWSKIPKNK